MKLKEIKIFSWPTAGDKNYSNTIQLCDTVLPC